MRIELVSVWPLLAAAVSLTLAVFAFVSGVKRTRGTVLFVLLNVATAGWAVTYFFQVNEAYLSTGISVPEVYGTVLLAVNGVAVAAVFTYLVLFCAWYSGMREWVRGWRLAVVHLPGLLYTVGQGTNPLHGHYISASEPGAWYTYGWLAYVNHTVAYLMLVAATVILIRGSRRGTGAFRPRETVVVVVGIMLVMLAGITWTLRQTMDSGVSVNPAVLLFALLGVVLAALTLRSPFGGLLSLKSLEAFDRMSDAAVVLDNTGRVTAFNSAFARFTPRAEPGEQIEELSPDLAAVLRSVAPTSYGESELLNESGVWWVRVVPPKTTDGDCSRLVLMTDLTSLRRAESTVAALSQELAAYVAELEDASRVAERRLRDLAVANERLEIATRTKDRFLANVSHELRTPLTSIIGLSSSLEAGRLGQLSIEQRSFARVIGDSGRHLLGLIEDLLDLEKAASGVMDVVSGPVDIVPVLRSAAETLKPQFDESGLYLFVHAPPTPVVVAGDERRLRQIVLNLLGNAVKFTDEGGVRVRLTCHDDEVAVEVADSGVGIASEQLERVFDEFEQIARADGSKSAGAGLGLSISRSLADLMGGSLTAESEPGEGTRFVLRLRAYRPTCATPHA